MNEIKKIHLGRQSFTISVDAYKALHEYLEAIRRQTGTNEEVTKEIESRMAELLTERGIDGDKVVLAEDVAFLREQLGKPSDFKEENAEEMVEDDQPKRLYRDTRQGMIAGVAAGLAAYFHIDPIIVRLLFVALTFAGGAGVFLYILLWILTPEARTPSDQLHMQGKAITVENLKHLVNEAHVPEVASRATKVVSEGVKLVFKLVGVVMAGAGIALSLWAIAMGVYFKIHGATLGSKVVFPVGAHEALFVALAVSTLVALGLLMIVGGAAMVRRKRAVPVWSAVVLVALLGVGGAASTALGFDIYPAIHDRYNAAHQTQTRTLTAFQSLTIQGDNTQVVFQPSSDYSVQLSYLGDVTRTNLLTEVSGNTLNINSTNFMNKPLCMGPCWYSNHDLQVIVHAPSLDRVNVNGIDSSFTTRDVLNQDNITVQAGRGSVVDLERMWPSNLTFDNGTGDGIRSVQITGIRKDALTTDAIQINEDVTTMGRAGNVMLKYTNVCDDGDPLVRLNTQPETLHINNEQPITSAGQLRGLHSTDAMSQYNCVEVL